MKRLFAITLVMLVTAVAGPVHAQLKFNPNQVAILRRYPANQTATFNVGNAPIGVTFDGANIWVANGYDDTVTKLRVSDGSVLGTFSAEGTGRSSVVFDGANPWVANYDSNGVTKLRASDGAVLGTFGAAGLTCPRHWVGLEACAGAHFMGAALREQGHEVTGSCRLHVFLALISI